MSTKRIRVQYLEGADLLNLLGDRVKELRIKKNLTQEQLATRASVSQGVVSSIERKMGQNITLVNLIKISKALDISPAVLLVDNHTHIFDTEKLKKENPDVENFSPGLFQALFNIYNFMRETNFIKVVNGEKDKKVA